MLYWCRSALSGLVRAARHAGTSVATITPPRTIASARANDDGVGRADAEQHAAEQPADAERRDDAERRADRAEPQAARRESRARRTSRDAPSAMRMPISCVLCLTVYDTSP